VDGNTTPETIHVTRRTIPGLGDQALLIIAPSSPILAQDLGGLPNF